MKKHKDRFGLCIVLFLIVILTGCSKGQKKDADNIVTPTVDVEETIQFDAQVMEVGEGLLVTPKEDTEEFRSSDQISVHLQDTTVKDSKGNDIDKKALQPGDIIRITYDGIIMESYPAQISANSIKVTGHNRLIDGYLELIDYIYQEDSGLNGDITMIALDTTGWSGLSEIEKEIIYINMKKQYGLEVIAATYEELVEQKLVDEEQLYFKNGILITLDDVKWNEKKEKITCSIEKWRSDLGAIGSEDTSAQYKDNDWKIKMKDMWIS